MVTEKSGEYSEKEAARRRDDALRRALNTPHKPHDSAPGKPTASRKKRAAAKPKNAS